MAGRKGWVDQFAEMRRLAETILRDRNAMFPTGADRLSEEDALRALHELSVHQIELEMQHDELHRALAQAEALQERAALFGTAWRLLPVAAWITDLDQGTILEANEAFRQLFGYAGEEVQDRDAREVPIWADPADQEEVLGQLAAEGTVRARPAPFCRKDGTRGWMAYTGHVLEQGGRRRVLSAAVDNTGQQDAC